MESRRDFLTRVAAPAAGVATAAPLNPGRLGRVAEAAASFSGTADDAARDADLWREVQQAFTVDRSMINLNNGGVSPSPATVQLAMKRHLDYSNTTPVYAMWRVLEPQREGVRRELAQLFGCDAEEVAITRNTSEGLETCQLGFDLEPGDEVLTTTQDYPRMVNTWKQLARRHGVVLRQFPIPTPCDDPAEIVRRFEANVTQRTRLILVSHVIFLTGQVMPVREVVRLGRSRGIPVIVDGAHAFAHLVFSRRDLDCDYYGTSLHKWLAAPHGTGMLYVRRDLIGSLWPLMAAPPEMGNDIRKFEEIGTHAAATALAVAEAIVFHRAIGAERKFARLLYLRDRWARQLAASDRVRFHSPLQPSLGCGLATFEIDGVDPGELVDHLWNRRRIIVTAIKHDEFQGVRVSPSVYTTLEELDRFSEAVEDVIARGLPS